MPESRRRVCHISTVHVHQDVRIFHRECKSLGRAGYHVHFVATCDEDAVIDGIAIHHLNRARNRFVRMLFMPWRALKRALETRADLYHYHDPELIFVGFLLRWLFRKKVVFDVHESVFQHILGKPYLSPHIRYMVAIGYRAAEAFLGWGQAIVVANENDMKNYRHATLVQNYPDTSAFVPTERVRASFSTAEPLLVYLGTVSGARGAYVYLQLAHKLKQRGVAFKMMIIGSYFADCERRMNELRAEWALERNVEIPGRIDWPDAIKIVSRATIGLCLLLPIPNYQVCLATKILEYMMVGTPVLCSRFDHWAPYVEGEGTGRMADPNDIDDVAQTCTAMLADPDELRRMSARGIRAVGNRYNWESEFQKLSQLYSKMLNGKTSSLIS